MFVDRKLSKLGFNKTEENEHGVYYARNISASRYDYVHVVCIIHKQNGNHLIQSYQKDVNSDKFNNVVGLTYLETKLIMKKYRQMKRKYRWK